MCVLCKMSKSLCASASKCNCEHVGLLMDSSLHSKATGLLHSRQQFLVKFLVRLIGRDVYPIKTRDRNAQLVASNLAINREIYLMFTYVCLPSVSLGQVVCVGVYQMNGEEPWSCRTCRTLHKYILVITALLWSIQYCHLHANTIYGATHSTLNLF